MRVNLVREFQGGEMHECMGMMFYFPLWCFRARWCAGSRGTLPFLDC